MLSLPRAWLALRITALLTGGFGLVALTSTGPRELTVITLALAGGGSYLSAQANEALRARVARIAGPVLLAVIGIGLAANTHQSALTGLKVCIVAVFLAHTIGLRTTRDALVGVIISLFMSVLPVATSADPRLSVLLVLCWLGAVTALVTGHHIGQLENAAVVAVRNRSVGTDVVKPVPAMARAVALAIVLGFLVFLVLPRPSGVAARRNVAGGVPRPLQSFGAANRSVGSYSGGALDLRARGDLPDTPMLDVPEGSPTLWRGAVLDTYDGTTWTQQLGGLLAYSADAGYVVGPDPVRADVPARPARTDSVRVRGPVRSFLVVAPGQPKLVRTHARLTNGPAGPMLVNNPGDAQYDVASTSAEADPAALASSDGPDPDDPRWTALPVGLPSRVRGLAASLVSPTGSRLETLEAIERDLHLRATYRLDSPVPPNGQDAVDHFLFDARTGFCEHFASAEVVLLRSLGIPARLVTGFAGGESMGGGRRLLRAKNAHAWVEVWFPGVGWVSSDPTAGTTLAQPSNGWLSRLIAAVSKALATGRGRALLALGVVTIVLVTWGGLWLLRRRRTARHTPPLAQQMPRGPLWAAFARLEVALAETGRASPPAETLSELNRRVSRRPEETRALDVLERACYSGSPPPPRDEKEAARVIEELATRLLADAAAKTGAATH